MRLHRSHGRAESRPTAAECKGPVVNLGSSVGPWRSWERASMASRRSWVRIPSAPPKLKGRSKGYLCLRPLTFTSGQGVHNLARGDGWYL